jgi:hypothetical protein
MRSHSFLHTYRHPLGVALFLGGGWWLESAINNRAGGGVAFSFLIYLGLTAVVAHKIGSRSRSKNKTRASASASAAKNATKTAAGTAAPTPVQKAAYTNKIAALEARNSELESELARERAVVAAMTEELSPDTFGREQS